MEQGSDATSSPLVVRRRLNRESRRASPIVGAFDGERCELLAQLCHPLKPEAFLKKVWRKHVLMVHGGARRFAALKRERLHNLSLPKLLLDSPSEEIHVWFSTASGGNESVKVADREAALSCHRAGGSLYFRAPDAASDFLVTAVTQQVGMSFGALYPDGAPRSEVETFVSRAGHVTNWHFDWMENFTLQLSGTKRWKLKRSEVDVPLRGCTPMWGRGSATVRSAAEQQAKLHAQHASSLGGFETQPSEAFFADAEEVVLKPGAVLYVPAGVWHRVECVDDSVSINVSLIGASWADLVADAIRQRLLCSPIARAPICLDGIRDGRKTLKRVLRRLQEELIGLTPEVLLPDAMALPRVVKMRLPPPRSRSDDLRAEEGGGEAAAVASAAAAAEEEEEDRGRRVRQGTRYRRGALAVLLRMPRKDDDGEEDEGDDNNDEEEGDDDESNDEAHAEDGEGEGDVGEIRERSDDRQSPSARAGVTRCGGEDELTSSSDLFRSDGHEDDDADPSSSLPPAAYVLHSHFGGEELGSWLRVEMSVDARLVPLMEWLRAAPPTFAVRSIPRTSIEESQVSWDEIYDVLRVLERNGYLVRQKSKPKGGFVSLEVE